MNTNQIMCGDCREVLRTFPDESVNCCVTSPPYWGLRDYGVAGQLGLEKTPEEYIEKMTIIFREVLRVLRKDGTCWVNMGDSYNTSGGKGRNRYFDGREDEFGPGNRPEGDTRGNISGLKQKDLCGIPWRLALSLQADGWYLRQDIIWAKPNPMPESVTDRCTKAHEYIFLLTKSAKYWYDAEAIKEEAAETNDARPRMGQGPNTQYKQKRIDMPVPAGWMQGDGSHGTIQKDGRRKDHFRNSAKYVNQTKGTNNSEHEGNRGGVQESNGRRNKRSVWTVATQPFPEAHFATFPEKLIEPCILAGCPERVCPKCGKARERIIKKGELVPDSPEYKPKGNKRGDSFVKNAMNPAGQEQGHPNFHYDYKTLGWTDCGYGVEFVPGLVLDPFMGAGTTALVAHKKRRNYVGIELKPEYIEMANQRIQKEKNKIILFSGTG